MSPTRKIDGSYANGCESSKWGGEVLLREANDPCGLPVAVLPRLMLSPVATGIAPSTFCVVSTVLAQAAARGEIGEISADSDWSPISDVIPRHGLAARRRRIGPPVDAELVRRVYRDASFGCGAPTDYLANNHETDPGLTKRYADLGRKSATTNSVNLYDRGGSRWLLREISK
jgi:hypothetical protein